MNEEEVIKVLEFIKETQETNDENQKKMVLYEIANALYKVGIDAYTLE